VKNTTKTIIIVIILITLISSFIVFKNIATPVKPYNNTSEDKAPAMINTTNNNTSTITSSINMTNSSAGLGNITTQIPVIRIGLWPQIGSMTSQGWFCEMPQYEAFIDYLNISTGYKWEAVFLHRDEDAITGIKTGKIDVGFCGVLPYALDAEDAGAEGFAQGVYKNGVLYDNSTIQATPEVAKTLGIDGNSPLIGTPGMKTLKSRLESHKGEYNLAYVDKGSLTGYGIARGTMVIAGLDPATYFKETTFQGSDPRVAGAVQARAVDMGVCSDSNPNSMKAQGLFENNSTVTIWISEPIPNEPVAYRKDLPQDVKDKIKIAFLNWSRPANDWPDYHSFEEANDSIYQPLRGISVALEKLTP